MKYSVLLVLTCHLVLCSSDKPACDKNGKRIDCGFVGVNQTRCENNKCCWNPSDNNPWCFHPNRPSAIEYIVDNIEKTTLGAKITIRTNGSSFGLYGQDITPLVVEISAQEDERLHVKIYDPNDSRWEVPARFSPIPDDPKSRPSSPLYSYKYPQEGERFYFILTRKDNNDVLFDTSKGEGLQFADQFLSISTILPDNYNLYGLGEHVTPYLKLNPRTYTMWNFDTPTPPYLNVYGSHPFYLDQRTSGKAHGVFLRNSNAMDVIVDDTSLTYNVIGGVLDFYFFLGPEPESVIQQYQQVIGRPHMPPYWALGFHQCRYGYPNVQALEDVVSKYKENQIPLDTMWTDIDYMDQYKDFTLDPNNFPKDEMNKFVSNLHANGQHYVVIIDPGIKTENGYSSYEDGLKMDIFVKDRNNNVFTGKVWPGITAFPDFFNPSANKYWENQISNFMNDLLPVDGLWIDMNEISNDCNGECQSTKTNRQPNSKEIRSSSLGFDPNNPPYKINNGGSNAELNVKTLDMDVVHYGGVLEYNAHNLFGLTETIATDEALENIRGNRSLVISRSTFPGTGGYGGHWTGDNHASWDDLSMSIPDILNFQMYGIPLIGADICGFLENTTEELCSRWIELGAFYPFSRNHNSMEAASQELYMWQSVVAISRKVLAVRYSLLPYYYTLFYNAHISVPDKPSATVLRPVFFEFPLDQKTYDIYQQFMIGSGILVSPVLQQGATSVQAYFPSSKWYDFYTLETVSEGSETKSLQTPVDHIQVHIRGGSIIPMQAPALTTKQSRMNNFSLLVALDSEESATGDLFWDDGESIKMSNYLQARFHVSDKSLTSTISKPVYSRSMPPLSNITIVGLTKKPSEITLKGSSIDFVYDEDTHSVRIAMNWSMKEEFEIKWK